MALSQPHDALTPWMKEETRHFDTWKRKRGAEGGAQESEREEERVGAGAYSLRNSGLHGGLQSTLQTRERHDTMIQE